MDCLDVMFSNWLKRRRKKKALKLRLKAKLYLRKAEICTQSITLCTYKYEAIDLLQSHTTYLQKSAKFAAWADYYENLA